MCRCYLSTADCDLKKLEAEQAQALRICSGAFKTSPAVAIQIEMGEMPLCPGRIKLMLLAYWVNLQGKSESHPAKAILQECWEHSKTILINFGWIGNVKAENVGLCSIQYCSIVFYSAIPPWLFVKQSFDLYI